MTELNNQQLTSAFQQLTPNANYIRTELANVMPQVVEQIKTTKGELHDTITALREQVVLVIAKPLGQPTYAYTMCSLYVPKSLTITRPHRNDCGLVILMKVESKISC